jgi:hypothetical protein
MHTHAAFDLASELPSFCLPSQTTTRGPLLTIRARARAQRPNRDKSGHSQQHRPSCAPAVPALNSLHAQNSLSLTPSFLTTTRSPSSAEHTAALHSGHCVTNKNTAPPSTPSLPSFFLGSLRCDNSASDPPVNPIYLHIPVSPPSPFSTLISCDLSAFDNNTNSHTMRVSAVSHTPLPRLPPHQIPSLSFCLRPRAAAGSRVDCAAFLRERAMGANGEGGLCACVFTIESLVCVCVCVRTYAHEHNALGLLLYIHILTTIRLIPFGPSLGGLFPKPFYHSDEPFFDTERGRRMRSLCAALS